MFERCSYSDDDNCNALALRRGRPRLFFVVVFVVTPWYYCNVFLLFLSSTPFVSFSCYDLVLCINNLRRVYFLFTFTYGDLTVASAAANAVTDFAYSTAQLSFSILSLMFVLQSMSISCARSCTDKWIIRFVLLNMTLPSSNQFTGNEPFTLSR